jgi:hypothetical protein
MKRQIMFERISGIQLNNRDVEESVMASKEAVRRSD